MVPILWDHTSNIYTKVGFDPLWNQYWSQVALSGVSVKFGIVFSEGGLRRYFLVLTASGSFGSLWPLLP